MERLGQERRTSGPVAASQPLQYRLNRNLDTVEHLFFNEYLTDPAAGSRAVDEIARDLRRAYSIYVDAS